MKEKPILFNTEMVKAILDGRKTQTRRVIKNIGNAIGIGEVLNGSDNELEWVHMCPYGYVGDGLWVRETFAIESNYIDPVLNPIPPYNDGRPVKWDGIIWEQCHYKADGVKPELYYEDDENDEPKCKWKPSIHMPRWASRITLEIIDVRIEQVQDISEAGAKAEGVKPIDINDGGLIPYICSKIGNIYKPAFSILWDSINEKRGYGWDENPWVWVIEFKMI